MQLDENLRSSQVFWVWPLFGLAMRMTFLEISGLYPHLFASNGSLVLLLAV